MKKESTDWHTLAKATRLAPKLPRHLTDLFVPETAYANWQAFNWGQRRFFLKDARLALGMLQFPHTAMDRYMDEAGEIIRDQTEWQGEYRGDFRSSKTQLYPKRITEAKYVDKAATIIVALALVAQRHKPDVDIYGTVRIVPAYYFVDGFNMQLLRTLEERARGEDSFFIAAALGLPSATSLETLWIRYLNAPASANHMLRDMALGFCVTKFIAEKAQAFFKAFGEDLNVLRAGEDGADPVLGTRAAAPSIQPILVR